MMGTLMAASTIPRVLLSPAAGVIVDRSDRKWLLVLMDVIRGVAVVLVGIAAYLGVARVWMVFGAGIIIGTCASFFFPAIRSIIPDIVARERLVQANSFFSMIRAGSGILGNSLGGILYTVLGAPLMFLINGLSYLFSSFTELFIRVPRVHHERERQRFWADLKSGLVFVWRSPGRRFLMMTVGVLNFFAFIAIVLILPFFKETDFLGPVRYGITMAVFTAGMIAGMLTIAAIKVPAGKRFLVFSLSTVFFVAAVAVTPLWDRYWPMLVCVAVGGYFNAIINVLIESVNQLTVPSAMRGKVMGLAGLASQGLTPLGMAIGGVLGEFFPLRWVIFGAMSAIGVFVFPQLGSKSIRAFFAMETEEQMPSSDS